MNLEAIGRLLLFLGLGLLVLGGGLLLLARLNLPWGRLPGDFRFQGRQVTCFVPLASSLLLSLLLTLLLNLLVRFLQR